MKHRNIALHVAVLAGSQMLGKAAAVMLLLAANVAGIAALQKKCRSDALLVKEQVYYAPNNPTPAENDMSDEVTYV